MSEVSYDVVYTTTIDIAGADGEMLKELLKDNGSFFGFFAEKAIPPKIGMTSSGGGKKAPDAIRKNKEYEVRALTDKVSFVPSGCMGKGRTVDKDKIREHRKDLTGYVIVKQCDFPNIEFRVVSIKDINDIKQNSMSFNIANKKFFNPSVKRIKV